MYQILLQFDKLYYKFTDAEKKKFIASFVEEIRIHESELPNGRFLKGIKFKFPVKYNSAMEEADDFDVEYGWDEESTLETCVLLSQQR